MHPCSSYSKTVKSLIELSIGFEVEYVESDDTVKPLDPKVCTVCGGKLIFKFILFSITQKGVDTDGVGISSNHIGYLRKHGMLVTVTKKMIDKIIVCVKNLKI